MESVLVGSATVGDCRGLCTSSTAASSLVFIIGGSSGVEDKALRSYGSLTFNGWTSSIGDTGLLLQIMDIAGVGGIMSFWSKPGKYALVKDDERLDAG
jgi:hypothetical protein